MLVFPVFKIVANLLRPHPACVHSPSGIPGCGEVEPCCFTCSYLAQLSLSSCNLSIVVLPLCCGPFQMILHFRCSCHSFFACFGSPHIISQLITTSTNIWLRFLDNYVAAERRPHCHRLGIWQARCTLGVLKFLEFFSCWKRKQVSTFGVHVFGSKV